MSLRSDRIVFIKFTFDEYEVHVIVAGRGSFGLQLGFAMVSLQLHKQVAMSCLVPRVIYIGKHYPWRFGFWPMDYSPISAVEAPVSAGAALKTSKSGLSSLRRSCICPLSISTP
jgi:hypothetical protein